MRVFATYILVQYTTAPACYIPWQFSSQSTATQCQYVNGTLNADLTCWLAGLTNESDCLPLPYCAGESDSLCSPFCYFPEVIDSASCNYTTCNKLNCSVVWNDTKNLCMLNAGLPVLLEECNNLAGAFWPGAVWQNGVRATNESCLGYCDDYPGALTKVRLSPLCMRLTKARMSA